MEAPALPIQPQVQLLITMTGERGVQVTGPIENKLLCYALLEMAKDAIREYRPSSIARPPMDFRLPKGVG